MLNAPSGEEVVAVTTSEAGGAPSAGSSVCGECSSVIRNAANLPVHMRRHLGYKPYHCSKCAHTGYDQDDVHRHASRYVALKGNMGKI